MGNPFPLLPSPLLCLGESPDPDFDVHIGFTLETRAFVPRMLRHRKYFSCQFSTQVSSLLDLSDFYSEFEDNLSLASERVMPVKGLTFIQNGHQIFFWLAYVLRRK